MKKLLEFAITAAEKMAGGRDTLFFPVEFAKYLEDYTYAVFDPAANHQNVGRHAVGHGRAKEDQYTKVRALQTILTIDQIAFYS